MGQIHDFLFLMRSYLFTIPVQGTWWYPVWQRVQTNGFDFRFLTHLGHFLFVGEGLVGELLGPSSGVLALCNLHSHGWELSASRLMRLHPCFLWQTLLHWSQVRWLALVLMVVPHESHNLVGSHGGPGLLSIPALSRRIRREWAGLVPLIGQKTTVGNDLKLALCWVSIRTSSRVGLQWLEVLQPVEFDDVHFADAQR